MYLQEWLSIPVYSLLGINLVGNHEMVEVVDPPESILLFSSFEFFWVRLVQFHPDLQVTVLPLEEGEAHHGVGRIPPFSSAMLCATQPPAPGAPGFADKPTPPGVGAGFWLDPCWFQCWWDVVMCP